MCFYKLLLFPNEYLITSNCFEMHFEKGCFTKKANIINRCQYLKFILQFALHPVKKYYLSWYNKWKMNKVHPCDSSSTDQSESATATDEPEDDIPSEVAPPIPKVQGLIYGRIDFWVFEKD